MLIPSIRTLFLSSVMLGSAFLSGCGSSSDSNAQTAKVSLGFSDAPVENLAQVVITVDYIELRRQGGDIIRVDTFKNQAGQVEETFTIDLLQYQGMEHKVVFEDLEVPVGEYQDLRIGVLDENEQRSYVLEQGDPERKRLKVPSDQLKLGGFTVTSEGNQFFVVEFGLRQAMTYNPGNNGKGKDRYILKPRGVRIVRVEAAATISGVVNLTNMNLQGACAEVEADQLGHVAYLYPGTDLNPEYLGDVFVRSDDSTEELEMDQNVPDYVIAPYAAVDIVPQGDGSGEFFFSYLPAGSYTLALSCRAAGDDPVEYQPVTILVPAPEQHADALRELNLTNGQNAVLAFEFASPIVIMPPVPEPQPEPVPAGS